MTNLTQFTDLIGAVQLPPEVKAVGLTRHDAQDALLVIVRDRGVQAFGAAEEVSHLFGTLPNLPLVMREVSGDLRATANLQRRP